MPSQGQDQQAASLQRSECPEPECSKLASFSVEEVRFGVRIDRNSLILFGKRGLPLICINVGREKPLDNPGSRDSSACS